MTTLQASSTIYDGVILKLSKNKHGEIVVVMRAQFVNYTSPPGLMGSTTDTEGNYQKISLPLSHFHTYYIDETLATQEQMAAHIRPGMRMVTMENKSNWYFLQVPNRNHDSHIGFLDAIDDQSITLVRPQIAANELMPIDGKADRYRSVNYQDRPHWRYNIPSAMTPSSRLMGQSFLAASPINPRSETRFYPMGTQRIR